MAELFFDGVSNLPVGLQTTLFLLLFMYLLHFLDAVNMNDRLKESWAVAPRRFIHPLCFFTYVWVHKDFRHLAGNTFLFLVFASVIALDDLQIFWIVTFVICLVSGTGVWLFAREQDSRHLGASGLNLGYIAYVVFRGLAFENVPQIVLGGALVIAIFFTRYSTFGNLRYRGDGTSNVGHWFGFLGGIVAICFMQWVNSLLINSTFVS